MNLVTKLSVAIFGIVMILMKEVDCMPRKETHLTEFLNVPSKPTQTRHIHLYSKHGHYVAILGDGKVIARLNQSSPDAVLEMLSYSVRMKRIRRPGSNLWLAIDKNGKIKTRKKKKLDTLFKERHDDHWLWYQNIYGYVLAFRKNFHPKNGVKAHDEKGKKTKFLIITSSSKSKSLS